MDIITCAKMFLASLTVFHIADSQIQSSPLGQPGGYGSRQPGSTQPKNPSRSQPENPQTQPKPQPSVPQPQKEPPIKPPTTSRQPAQPGRKEPSQPIRAPPSIPTQPPRKPDATAEPVRQPGGASRPGGLPSTGGQSQPPVRPPANPRPPQTSGGGIQPQRQPQPAAAPRPQPPQPQPAPRPQPAPPPQRQPQPSNNLEGTICASVCTCQQGEAKCNQQNLRKFPRDPWPSGISAADFDENLISALEPNGFNKKEIQPLQKLSLSFNQLKNIQANTFQGLSNLIELSLTGNTITSLESGSFNGLSALETLRLEQNKLTEISGDAFMETGSLQEILLDENELETIDVDFFDQASSVAVMSLGSNPWKCNCKLLGVLIWVSAGNQVQGEAVCSKPDDMAGRELTSFTYSDVQTMCSDAWDDDTDDPVISPEEERERQRMNESCSEHTSDDPLDICYISKDVQTSPGKYVCLHCLGTTEEDDNYAEPYEEEPSDYGYAEDEELDSELDISWNVPSSANSSDDANRITVHENGTLCIENIKVSDGGKYTCTIKMKNHTRTDSVVVTVASLAVQVAVGVVIGVVVLFGAISAIFLRWWLTEVDSESTQIVPMDIQDTKQ